jgi:hypothetical protein
MYWPGECCVKLKDYEIPQYGPDHGDQEDLKQYSLKNFDLNVYQPTLAAAPDPVQSELNQLAFDPGDVQFGPHFNLQPLSYRPFSQPEPWKMPRWVVTMVGIFFGSAAVLALVFCVVLLRDPKAAPTAQMAVPTTPVATTPAAPVTRAAPAPAPPPTANLMHDDSAPGHRIVVSRHPSIVRRQVYGPRRVAPRSTSSSVAPQETETASRRPPQDDLDKLLSGSSL